MACIAGNNNIFYISYCHVLELIQLYEGMRNMSHLIFLYTININYDI